MHHQKSLLYYHDFETEKKDTSAKLAERAARSFVKENKISVQTIGIHVRQTDITTTTAFGFDYRDAQSLESGRTPYVKYFEYMDAMIGANIIFDVISIGRFANKNNAEDERCGNIWKPKPFDYLIKNVNSHINIYWENPILSRITIYCNTTIRT